MEKGMRITELRAENVKGIKAVDITPGPHVNTIGGKNEAGKSTTLDCIMYGIGGQKDICEKPLRTGAKKGEIEIRLEGTRGTYIVKRTFTEAGGGTITVRDGEDRRYASTQKLLDEFYNDFSFDPLEFANAPAKKQTEMILQLVTLEADTVRIAELGNVPETEIADLPDVLERFKTARANAYEDRTLVGRDLKGAKESAARTLVPDIAAGTEAVDVSALMDDAKRLGKIRDSKAVAKKEMDLAFERVESQQEIIGDIEARLSEAKGRLKGLSSIYTRAHAIHSKIDDVSKRLAIVNEKISGADTINTAIRQRDLKATLTDERDKQQARYDTLSTNIGLLDAYRDEVLKNAEMPVAGLGFDTDGNIVFEGEPVAQRGMSKKIFIGMNICSRLNPELRVILIRNGNDLDTDNMSLIEDWARLNQFQIWIERVADSDEDVSFFIEDGSCGAALEDLE